MKAVPSSRKIDAKYDILKFLFSFIVVAAHAHVFSPGTYLWLRNMVPIYFMISAAFLFSKLNRLAPEEQSSAFRKYMGRNLTLYIFWLIPMLPLNMIFNWPSYVAYTPLSFILQLIRKVLVGDPFVAAWYLPATIWGTALVYIIGKKLGHNAAAVCSVLAFVFVTVRASYFCLFEDNLLIWRLYHYYELILDFAPLSFPYAMMWIFMGKCFGENRIKDRPVWVLLVFLVVSCLGLYLEGRFTNALNGAFNNESYFMNLPVAVCLFALFRKLPAISVPMSERLRHFSTFLFVTHSAPLLALRYYFPRFHEPENTFLVFLLTTAICSVLFVLAEWYRERFAHHKFAKLLLKVF